MVFTSGVALPGHHGLLEEAPKEGWGFMNRRVVWVLLASLGWLGLVLVAVWMKAQPASLWRVLEAPVTVVAGGFAAVVVAALLFDPIKFWVARAAADEVERREDQRWLRDKYPHARATQDALRHEAAIGAALLYEAVASTGALTAVIPSETLRWDVRRLPPTHPALGADSGPEELAAMFQALAQSLKDDERSQWTGPMALANIQLKMVLTVLRVHQEEEQIAHVVRIMGADYSRNADDRVWLVPERHESVPGEVRERLTDTAVEALASFPDASVADRLAIVASRLLNMGNAVAGARDFDPAPLTRALLVLTVQSERLRYVVSSPTAHAVVMGDGTVREATTGDPWPNALDRMRTVVRVWRAMMDVRSQLLQATAQTLEAASRLGADTRNAWLDDPTEKDDILGSDGSWDLWRLRNHVKFESD